MTDANPHPPSDRSPPERPASHVPARRRLRSAIVLLVVAAVAITAWVAANQYLAQPKRFAAVRPGILYRSAQPKPRHLKPLIEQYGIRTLLIVRDTGGESVAAEIAEARRLGLRVVEAPVESRQPVPDARINQFFACVDDPDMQPVLVHCSAGRHRTGVVCAAYRIERDGWAVDRAVDEMLSFGFDIVDHEALLNQVRSYRARNPARAATAATPENP